MPGSGFLRVRSGTLRRFSHPRRCIRLSLTGQPPGRPPWLPAAPHARICSLGPHVEGEGVVSGQRGDSPAISEQRLHQVIGYYRMQGSDMGVPKADAGGVTKWGGA